MPAFIRFRSTDTSHVVYRTRRLQLGILWLWWCRRRAARQPTHKRGDGLRWLPAPREPKRTYPEQHFLAGPETKVRLFSLTYITLRGADRLRHTERYLRRKGPGHLHARMGASTAKPSLYLLSNQPRHPCPNGDLSCLTATSRSECVGAVSHRCGGADKGDSDHGLQHRSTLDQNASRRMMLAASKSEACHRA